MKKVLILNKAVDHMHFVSSISEELLVRGVAVTVWFTKKLPSGPEDVYYTYLAEFGKKYPHFSYDFATPRRDFFTKPLFIIRGILNYRRYLVVEGQSPYYRDRMVKHMSGLFELLFTRFPRVMNTLVRPRWVARLLMKLQSLAPASAQIKNRIREGGFDMVITMAGNMQLSAPDVEHIKAAKSLGLPTAMLIKTWDSMTNKGLIYEIPDRVFAWNEAHKHDAQTHHGIDPSRVSIVGSPVADTWFSPPFERDSMEESKRHLGLPPDREVVLYLGSSPSSAPDDRFVVEGLRRALDGASEDSLRRALLLVRPHPSNTEVYEQFEMEGVVVYPRTRNLPGTPTSKQLANRSYRTARVCIGVNTSAMFEAMIEGTPVISYLVPEYAKTQSEAEHFRELEESGAIGLARSPEECLSEIRELFSGNDSRKERREQFLSDMLRPRGREKKAGALIADEVLSMLGLTN